MLDIKIELGDLFGRFAARFGKVVLGATTTVVSVISDSLKQNFSEYYEATISRCANIRTLISRDVPIPIDQIYVATSFRSDGNVVSEKDFFDNLPKLKSVVIIGSGGSGKSVFMRHLFLTLAHGKLGIMPIFAELRGLNALQSRNLIPYIYHTVITPGATITEKQFERGVKQGAFYLILDGFDEVDPSYRAALEKEIIELQQSNRNLVIVISSREDDRFRSWQNFRIFNVQPMSKDDVVELIKKLPYEKSIRNKFAEAVRTNLYAKHNSFLSNPLLATMMLITYEQFAHIPDKIHIFYEQAFETLFFRHDSSKEAAFQRKRHTDLAINEFKNCLSSFCMTTYVKTKFQFSEAEILEAIKSASDYERIEVKSENYLKDLLESVCIIQRDGLYLTFTHRSFQEYFSAYFISRNPPVDIGRLLDGLANRSEDNVISMSFDINRDLIERTWLLPKIRMLTSKIGDIPEADLIGFSKNIIGEFTLHIADGHRRCSLGLRKEAYADLAFLIHRLYPKCFGDLFGCLRNDQADYSTVNKHISKSRIRDGLAILKSTDNKWIKTTTIGEHFRRFRNGLLNAGKEIEHSVHHAEVSGRNLILFDTKKTS